LPPRPHQLSAASFLPLQGIQNQLRGLSGPESPMVETYWNIGKQIAVIENPDVLQSIDESTAKMFGKPDMHPLYGAPTFIIVSVKLGDARMRNTEYSNCNRLLCHTYNNAI